MLDGWLDAGIWPNRSQGPAPKLLVSRPCIMADGMPAALLHWLEDWGIPLRRKVVAAAAQARAKAGLSPAGDLPDVLTVGTDCSGIEAPIHALRGLRVQHAHEFASECATAPRQMIKANTMPKELLSSVFEDCKTRFVQLYVSGFSCKPFSMLHHDTMLLEEEQAKIFYAVVRRIGRILPACFVLENVQGIARVKTRVLDALQQQGYVVAMILLNPVDLGEPVQRPRYYFIGVRADVCNMRPEHVHTCIVSMWSHIRQACQAEGSSSGVMSRLLPASHPWVQKHQSFRKDAWMTAREKGFPGRAGQAKWHALHESFAASRGYTLPTPSMASQLPSSDNFFLRLPREREAWTILSAVHSNAPALSADLSQNINRAGVRIDGTLATVTPGGLLAVREAGRVVSPMEKLILHGFPVHRMTFPRDLCDKDLACMAGNTMHVQAVGLAMLMACSLVNWSLQAACEPRSPPRKSCAGWSKKLQASASRGPKSRMLRKQVASQCQLTKTTEARLGSRWGLPAKSKRGGHWTRPGKPCGAGKTIKAVKAANGLARRWYKQ